MFSIENIVTKNDAEDTAKETIDIEAKSEESCGKIIEDNSNLNQETENPDLTSTQEQHNVEQRSFASPYSSNPQKKPIAFEFGTKAGNFHKRDNERHLAQRSYQNQNSYQSRYSQNQPRHFSKNKPYYPPNSNQFQPYHSPGVDQRNSQDISKSIRGQKGNQNSYSITKNGPSKSSQISISKPNKGNDNGPKPNILIERPKSTGQISLPPQISPKPQEQVILTKKNTEITVEKPKVKVTAAPPPTVSAKKPNQVSNVKIQRTASQPITVTTFGTGSKAITVSVVKASKRFSQNTNSSTSQIFLSCPICQFVCRGKSYLYEHFIYRHRLLSNFYENFSEPKDSEGFYTCKICAEKIKSEKELQAHVFVRHDKEMLKMLSECHNIPISKYAIKIAKEDQERERRAKAILEAKSLEEEPKKEDSTKEKTEGNNDDKKEEGEAKSDDDLSSVSESYSDVSDDSDSSDEMDDAYMAFVTSTMNMAGIIASGTKTEEQNEQEYSHSDDSDEEQTEQKSDGSEQKSDTEEQFDFDMYLISLSFIEQFMKKNSAIQLTPYPRCHICSKEFSSAISLMKHCYDTHRPRLTNSLLKVLDFLSPGITYNLSMDDEIFLTDDIRMDLLLHQQITRAPENPTVVMSLDMPSFVADTIIECLAVNDHQQMSNREDYMIHPKNLSKDILLLRLPSPLPVIVSTANNITTFNLIDTPHCPAEIIREILINVHNNVLSNLLIVMNIKDAHENVFPHDRLVQIAENYPITIMHTNPVKNSDGLVSLTLFVYCSYMTNEMEEDLKEDLVDLYYESEMSRCTKCGQIYEVYNPSHCPNGEEHDQGDQISSAEFLRGKVEDFLV